MAEGEMESWWFSELLLDDKLLPAQKPSRSKCAACHNMFKRNLIVPTNCCHYYCHGCIIKMAKASLNDETRYPIECCEEPIPYNAFAGHLPRKVLKAFDKRRSELDIPTEKRIYCPFPTCLVFVGSIDSALEGHIDCKKCCNKICIRCRLAEHPGTPCDFSEDSATLALRDLALEKNWKTCPRCGWIIERKLNEGCNFVICRCRTKFCYICCGVISYSGRKNCHCPVWPLQAYLIQEGNRGDYVYIEEMLSRSKDEAIRHLICYLSQIQILNLSNVFMKFHIPCDIENCCEQHIWTFKCEYYSMEIIIRISHESSSN